MKKFLIVTFIAILFTASQAAATLIMSYDFTFAGNGATAIGTISFDMAILGSNGRYLYDPGSSYTNYGATYNGAFVTALTVMVSGSSNTDGNRTFSLADFDGVLFDTSQAGVDFSKPIFGQVLAGVQPDGSGGFDPGYWGSIGTLIPMSGNPLPPSQSYNGDFQLFSPITSDAPYGTNPFEISALGGESMQLTSFAPSSAVATPEPGTMMLLGSGVLTFAVSRFRRRKEISA